MNVIDIVVIALIALAALVGALGGFHKGGLNNVFTFVKIGGLILLTPVVVKSLSGIEAISNLLSQISKPIDDMVTSMDLHIEFLNGIGGKVANAALYVVAFLALLIVLSIIIAIVKKLIRVPFSPKREPGGGLLVFDKLFGAIFNIVLYGGILFAILAILPNLPVPAVADMCATSKLCEINPLAPLFANMFPAK